MGCVVTKGAHQSMLAKKDAERTGLERELAGVDEHGAADATRHGGIQGGLDEKIATLKQARDGLAAKQAKLTADYNEMEREKKEKEAQVGSKIINRIKNRSLVAVLKGWQGYTLGIIRERDRQEYEYQIADLQAENEKLMNLHKSALAELEETRKYGNEAKAKQLMQRIMFAGVSQVFSGWKAFIVSIKGDKVQRQADQLERRQDFLVTDHARLTAECKEAEMAGLHIAHAKYEIEEKVHVAGETLDNLSAALGNAKQSIDATLSQWPASSSKIKTEVQALDQACGVVDQYHSTKHLTIAGTDLGHHLAAAAAAASPRGSVAGSPKPRSSASVAMDSPRPAAAVR